MANQISKTIVTALLFCVTTIVLTACSKEDDISKSAAAVVIPLNTGDISQAVAE